jgi:hypothetical protein
MPQLGLNPQSQCSRGLETVHDLDRAAIVIGFIEHTRNNST